MSIISGKFFFVANGRLFGSYARAMVVMTVMRLMKFMKVMGAMGAIQAMKLIYKSYKIHAMNSMKSTCIMNKLWKAPFWLHSSTSNLNLISV